MISHGYGRAIRIDRALPTLRAVWSGTGQCTADSTKLVGSRDASYPSELRPSSRLHRMIGCGSSDSFPGLCRPRHQPTREMLSLLLSYRRTVARQLMIVISSSGVFLLYARCC
jgi:hypothetical protein